MTSLTKMTSLTNRTILVVEDEGLIALDVETTLKAEGCQVVGPFGSVAAVFAALATGVPLDGALLDVNLRSENVFPVADALAQANVPFVLVTGHSASYLPAAHRSRPILSKPYLDTALIETLTAAVTAAPHTATT